MEAKAKHNFTATDADELSFKKHDLLKILNIEEDANWYQAEKGGEVGLIPCNHVEFKVPTLDCPQWWYVRCIGRVDAEAMLMEKDLKGMDVQHDGSFLVRMSENVKGGFSISLKCGGEVQHFKVTRNTDKYSVWSKSFNSLNDVIDFYRTSPISKSYHVLLSDRRLLKVVANYDYKPQDDEELEIKRGDILVVTRKQDENWWEGELMKDSRVLRGLFPMTFVTVISQ